MRATSVVVTRLRRGIVAVRIVGLLRTSQRIDVLASETLMEAFGVITLSKAVDNVVSVIAPKEVLTRTERKILVAAEMMAGK